MIPTASLYNELSKEELLAVVLLRDARIEELEVRHEQDRRTLVEYAQLIRGKKSEKHIRTLAEADLNAAQGIIPFGGTA